jgi:GT2 family glycosyltransferase
MVGGTSWENWGDKIQVIRNVGGLNYAFKKEAFNKVGFHIASIGYQQSEKVKWNFPSGEEVELSLRITKVTGKCIVFNPRMKVYHKVPKAKIRLRTLAKRAYRLGYSRHMVEKFYSTSVKGAFLNPELKLFRRIFSILLPNIFAELFKRPLIAWKKLVVTFIGTFFTGLGYLVYLIKPFKLEVR